MKWSSVLVLAAMATLFIMGAGPGQAGPDAALVGTYWRAVEINGQAVAPQPEKREAHLSLTAEGKRVSGSTGCNRIVGTFEQTGDSLRLSKMAATKMACPPPINTQEMAFLGALRATAAAQVAGNTLTLKDAAGKVVMRLEACKH